MKKGEYIDITGKVYGKLTVESFAGFAGRETLWNCICSCGNETTVRKGNLRSGTTRSCGCLVFENQPRPMKGLSGTKEYRAWKNAIDRCTNPNHKSYVNYGGRGITVDESWLGNEGFFRFYADLGPAPEGFMLERVDNNKGYSADNCIWADRSKQAYNQRIRTTNKSGRTGVSWSSTANKWVSQITYNNTNMNLGFFESFEDAVKAREEAELKYFGFNKE